MAMTTTRGDGALTVRTSFFSSQARWLTMVMSETMDPKGVMFGIIADAIRGAPSGATDVFEAEWQHGEIVRRVDWAIATHVNGATAVM